MKNIQNENILPDNNKPEGLLLSGISHFYLYSLHYSEELSEIIQRRVSQ